MGLFNKNIDDKVAKIKRKGEIKVSVKANQLESAAMGAVVGTLAFGVKGGVLGGLGGLAGDSFKITKLLFKEEHFEFKDKSSIIRYSRIVDVVPEKNNVFRRKYGTFDGFVVVYLDNDSKLEISCNDFIPLSIVLREKMSMCR